MDAVTDNKPDQRHAPPKPWWRDGSWWLRCLLTYTIAILGGYVAKQVSVPLPWMLGPFFLCAALSAFGARLAYPPLSRELGQLVVGLAVGLRFTPATLLATASLLPVMLAGTLYIMVFTFIAALIFRPLAGLDRTTAFFATAAGGVADMAIVAKQRGGDSNAVALVHALRVSSVVAIVPVLAITFGAPGSALASSTAASTQNVLLLGGVLVLAYCVARLLKPTPLPNPWLVGPMLLGVALGASGLLSLAVPPILIVVAQIVIGTWLGCQFRREVLLSVPRVAAAGIAVSLFMILAAMLGAFVMASVTILPVTTSFLALAPAAVTEMVITAKVMHLDAEIVTAFHIMRIAIVCSTVLLVFKAYNHLTGAAYGSRI
jgi:membrane AbrB-like protein